VTSTAERLGRSLSVRALVGVAALAVTAWYLFVADTAADNDLAGGIGEFVDGIRSAPAFVADTSAYSSFWEFMVEDEGIGEIIGHTIDHAQLVLSSIVAAIVISLGLGILAHRVKAVRDPALSVASILLTVPSLALFSVFISISFIGIGDRGPLIALTLYSILPILRNTVTGLDEVDSAIVESARGMGLSAFQRLVRVELPMAWPVILTGIRVATLLNVGIAAIAKLVGGTGLGFYINDGLTRYPNVGSVERMWTGVLWTILLALALDLVFTLIRSLTTPKGLR
jgi:osmoprotectant transport system permease protein